MKRLIKQNRYGRKITASNRSNKRAIMAGAGSAITIEFDDVQIDGVKNYGTKGANLTATATGTVYVQSIGTLNSGGRVDESVPCTFQFNLFYDDAETMEEDVTRRDIEDILEYIVYFEGFVNGVHCATFSAKCFGNGPNSELISSGRVNITIENADFVNYLDQLARMDPDDAEYYEYNT